MNKREHPPPRTFNHHLCSQSQRTITYAELSPRFTIDSCLVKVWITGYCSVCLNSASIATGSDPPITRSTHPVYYTLSQQFVSNSNWQPFSSSTRAPICLPFCPLSSSLPLIDFASSLRTPYPISTDIVGYHSQADHPKLQIRSAFNRKLETILFSPDLAPCHGPSLTPTFSHRTRRTSLRIP